MVKTIKVDVTLHVTAHIPVDDKNSMDKLRALQDCLLPDDSGEPPWLLVGATREKDGQVLFSKTGGRVERINVVNPPDVEEKA